jgi:secreted trypsin-like serine protease
MYGKTQSGFGVLMFLSLILFSCEDGNISEKIERTRALKCFKAGQKVAIGVPCRSSDVGVVKVTYFDDEDNPSVCSGTLIAGDRVLSAAHCLNGAVYRGTVSSDEKSVEIKDAYIHPDFRFDGQRFHHDVAVLTLQEEITQVPLVQIQTDVSVKSGDELYISGVGVSDLSDPSSYGSLRAGSLLAGQVASDFIYAPFDPNRDTACVGDSGGGVFLLKNEEPVQVGVISSGTQEKCGKGDINVFTNLSDPNLQVFLNDPLLNGRQFSENPY